MANSSTTRTSASLLQRLRHETIDQGAWSEFVRRYGRHIYHWCRAWHLQEADAQDVTQTVLLKLAAKLRTFHYDPARSFRAYLKTLTRYAWYDFLDSSQRPDAADGGSAVLEFLHTAEARDDLLQHLNEEFDREVLAEALARVQRRVASHTWDAFRLVALEGRPAAAVAAQLALKVAAVYVAKGRVQQLLQ